MPLPFSFFGSKHRHSAPVLPAEDAVSAVPESVGNEIFATGQFEIPESPFPRNPSVVSAFESGFPHESDSEGFESIPTVLLPPADYPPVVGVTLPERRGSPKGLAAMVVRQSEIEAPPLNKRSPFPSSPFSTLLGSPPQEPPTKLDTNPFLAQTSIPPPAAPTAPPEFEDLRQDLHGEIEQVKNDLFGAVMGVSALKDRLDGLEAQLTSVQSASPAPIPVPPSKLEIEPVVISWLDDHLPAAIERMLADAQERMLGTPGAAFFRSSVPLSEAERQNLFSQPPVILHSTPV